MDAMLVAALVQEGSRVLTEVLRMRLTAKPTSQELTLENIGLKRYELERTYEENLLAPPPALPEPAIAQEKQVTRKPAVDKQSPPIETGESLEGPEESEVAVKAKSIEAGCLPCSLGHVGVCSGLLNEAVRFSENGMDDPEVIDRLNACLDELNAMERIDLRPEKIKTLPEWERSLADKVLKTSRATRHGIEGCRTKDQLVDLAGTTQTLRKEIGKEWFQTKIRTFTPDDKEAIAQRVIERLEKMGTEPEPEPDSAGG